MNVGQVTGRKGNPNVVAKEIRHAKTVFLVQDVRVTCATCTLKQASNNWKIIIIIYKVCFWNKVLHTGTSLIQLKWLNSIIYFFTLQSCIRKMIK